MSSAIAAIEAPTEPCAVRGADGIVQRRRVSAAEQRALFCRLLLTAAEPGEHVHLWPGRRRPDGSLAAHRRGPEAYRSVEDLDDLLELAAGWHAAGREVFAGMLPRVRPEPARAAVTGGSVVWLDVDDPGELGRLRAFCRESPPHYLGYSGRSGGRHAAWLLAERHLAAQLEAANRRLAHACGGDLAVCHAGASLRLPGTVNRKVGGGWCRIVACDLRRDPYRLDQLVGGLPEPSREATKRPGRLPAPRRFDALAAITPPAYFAALCGVPVGPDGGLVRCPLPGHDDEHPSCMVYATPEQGWRCFSHPGGAGGRIYDLASALAGGPTGADLRGEAFRDVARDLRARLHLT